MTTRKGSILIVVAGLSAILVALALGFLMRMRTDGEESRAMVLETQARLMLYAGLQYVQEGSRLGWDDPGTPEHEEAYGWVDVRDGRIGPCGRLGQKLFTASRYPDVGTAARCPLQVMQRPPFAIALDIHPNAMVLDANLPWNQILNRTKPDPAPADADPAKFIDGDRSARFPMQAWFRTFRKSPSVFIVTCGAGATAGFRDWPEVAAAGQEAVFSTREQFDDLRRNEHVLWFEVEWSAAVAGDAYYHYDWQNPNKYILNPTGHPYIQYERINSRQFGGTFTYIQRLRDEPAQW
jgi:hypothetical protein